MRNYAVSLSLPLLALVISCGGSSHKDANLPEGRPQAPIADAQGNKPADEKKVDETDDKDGDDQSPIPIPPAPIPAPTPDDVPAYQPLTNVFPDTNEILSSADTTTTLGKLRSIASPTDAYHESLLALVQNADGESLDYAHLEMIMQSVFFTNVQYQEMVEELKGLDGPRDEKQRLRADKLQRLIGLAVRHSEYLTRIAAVGIRKATKLNTDQVDRLLGLLIAARSNNLPFDIAIERFPPSTHEAKHAMMLKASRKNAPNSASNLAVEIFTQTTDESAGSLRRIGLELEAASRDLCFLRGFMAMGSMSFAEAVDFTSLAADKGTIAVAAYKKSNVKSHKKVMELANYVGKFHLQTYVENITDHYEQIATSEIIDLCNLASGGCAVISNKASGKWSNASVTGAIAVAELLDFDTKDRWLKNILRYFNEVSSVQILALVSSSYAASIDIALDLLDKNITDFNPNTLIVVAGELEFSAKDRWLKKGLGKLHTLTSSALAQILNAAYNEKMAIATTAAGKISDLDGEKIAAIATILDLTAKDSWINAALVHHKFLTTRELAVILGSAYNTKAGLASAAAPHITDLNGRNIAVIATLLEFSGKDIWVKAALRHVKQITGLELALIIDNAYSSKTEIAKDSASLVSDLNGQSIVAVAEELEFGGKDTWIKAALDQKKSLTSLELVAVVAASYASKGQIAVQGAKLVTDLTAKTILAVAGELDFDAKDTWMNAAFDAMIEGGKTITSGHLVAILGEAYSAQARLASKAVAILSDLNVARAVVVAEALNFGAKDTFLLAAIEKIADLKQGDETRLSEVGYDKKAQIRARVLARIGR
jgi:hypothetical protein